MYRRPDSVAAIGYLLIIGGCIGVLYTLFHLSDSNSDLPSYYPGHADSMLVVADGIAAAVCLISGLKILNGQNWARWLFTLSCAAAFVYDITFLFDKFYALVPATVIRTIIIVFLFLPDANKYFRGGSRW